jgi:hypothetical protein
VVVVVVVVVVVEERKVETGKSRVHHCHSYLSFGFFLFF